MKNAVIFHGTDEKPTDQWFPWLKEQMEQAGFDVEVPYYPKINKGPVTEILPAVLASHRYDDGTVLIGHSSGAPLILSILEKIDAKIKRAILVAGFCEPLPGPNDPILQNSYDWPRIKEHAQEFVFINSDNDPWGCDDKQGRSLFDRLGGTLIIRHDGHFGSETHKDILTEFPLLKELALAEQL